VFGDTILIERQIKTISNIKAKLKPHNHHNITEIIGTAISKRGTIDLNIKFKIKK
jgi:hypothetical protein